MTDITILDRAEKIGKRIKTERERLGITQGELGEKITEILNSEGGVAQATISGWERGKQIPPLALDSRIVENAALMEMEQALINLKHIKKQRMGASEHG